MNNILLALQTGIDVPIEECRLVIHQPSIKEISYIGEREFFSGIQVLTLKKELYENDKDKVVLDNTTNFQVFMTIMLDERGKVQKQNVEQTLTILFPDYKVAFTPQSLLLTKEGQIAMVDNNNFEVFQDAIASIACVKPGMGDQYNPKGKDAKKIVEKIMKARQKVAAQKGESSSDSLATYVSSIAVAFHLDVNCVNNYTIFQIYDILQRYQLYMAWDIDIRSRLAGGKPDEQPDNWMKNIHNI